MSSKGLNTLGRKFPHDEPGNRRHLTSPSKPPEQRYVMRKHVGKYFEDLFSMIKASYG